MLVGNQQEDDVFLHSPNGNRFQLLSCEYENCIGRRAKRAESARFLSVCLQDVCATQEQVSILNTLCCLSKLSSHKMISGIGKLLRSFSLRLWHMCLNCYSIQNWQQASERMARFWAIAIFVSMVSCCYDCCVSITESRHMCVLVGVGWCWLVCTSGHYIHIVGLIRNPQLPVVFRRGGPFQSNYK